MAFTPFTIMSFRCCPRLTKRKDFKWGLYFSMRSAYSSSSLMRCLQEPHHQFPIPTTPIDELGLHSRGKADKERVRLAMKDRCILSHGLEPVGLCAPCCSERVAGHLQHGQIDRFHVPHLENSLKEMVGQLVQPHSPSGLPHPFGSST